jgi:phosphomannomutase
MPKHFFFDLDNTLTRSKSHIDPKHVPILRKLAEKADVIVVSGHGENDIRAHIGPELEGTYHILGQNGNFAQTKNGEIFWERPLFEHQRKAIHNFIAKARAHINLPVKDEDDLVEDRGSQIAYSLIGHHEDRDVKEAFDPDHSKRHGLLRDLKDEVERLAHEFAVEIRSGGTTVLDMFHLGKNKGYNVAEFIEKMGWKKDESIYVGDALFPGGNDETVIGVIPTKSVKNYHETYEYLSSLVVQ